MLSQVSNSSKRLGKLKKYKSKVKQSGFQFLLKSLERDKENQAPNHGLNMTHSVRIDPLLTAPAQQILMNQCHTDTFTNPRSFYIQNVKLLDRSDVTLSDINNSNPSKRSPKHRNSKRQSSKSRHSKQAIKNPDSGKSKDSQTSKRQQIIYKTKQYLAITDQIINSVDALKWRHSKKAINIAKELIAMISTLQISEKEGKSGMNHSVKTTSFNIYNSQILKKSKEPQSYARIINNLEQQKEKLNSLISQHQMANIKLYIKMNEGESDEIEQCKKQLSMLFDKYKQLQSLIKVDKKRIAEILSQKQKLSTQCQQLRRQNSQLVILTEKYQALLQKKTKPKKQQPQKSRRQFDFREQSFSRIEQNRQNSIRSELRIESLQNSLNSSRFQQELGLGSSITTSTSRMNKKGGRLGINLSCLDNPSPAYLQALAEEPQRLKRTLQECRQALAKFQNVINQQNKQLQISIMALEDFKNRAEKSEQNVITLQSRLNAQKEHSKKIQKQNRNILNENETRIKKSKKQIQSTQKPKNNINIDHKKIQNDEYRIIALQATALEQALSNPRRK